MKQLDINDIMKGKKVVKTTDGAELTNVGNSIIKIYSNGRIEEINKCKVIKTKRGIKMIDVEFRLIDEGLI